MQIHQLRPTTQRKGTKRVGRGGKRGTTSGHGTKGQKGRAGAGVRPGFAGGDNRKWQLFPKQRGASHKPGNSRPHRKHRFYQTANNVYAVLNLGDFNVFENGATVTPQIVVEKGLVERTNGGVKVLGGGALAKKLTFEGFRFSKSAKEKAEKFGAIILPLVASR